MRILRLFRNLFRRRRLESDMDAELQSWVDHVADDKVKSGMSAARARRAALVESGGIEQVKEHVRDARSGIFLETVLRDIRFGARLLAKNRGFTAAAVTMLALGIGANTAVFSVVNSVLVRSLPYSEPDRIVTLYEKRPAENNFTNVVSAPDFLDWREQNQSFESMSAVVHDVATWQNDAGAEQILAGFVSPEFFDVLGVRPAVGAGFRKESEIRGRYDAVVLTHGVWQRRFGSDPAMLGRSITIDGAPREIVGILPATFEYPVQDVELFLPIVWPGRDKLNRSSHIVNVIGRMKPGVTLRSAQTEMDTIAARLEREHPGHNKGHGVNIVSMRDVLLGPIRLPLLALQGAVAFVLLIACGNFANLLLARTIARERELSVRLAIGAGRGRLIRQLLCESTLLALIGGAAGVALAYCTVPLLRALAPPDLPVLGIRTAEVDATVLGACLLLSVVCGLIFGLAPAWRGAGIATTLREGSASYSARGEGLRKTLIATQIALSVTLLTGAGMFLRSFAALRSVDPGFRAQGLLTMQIAVPGSRYSKPEDVIRFTSEWMDEIRRLPGVRSLGLINHLPVSGMDGRRGLAIEGIAPPDPKVPRRAHIRYVGPGYFETMGIRIVQGRSFLESDRAGSTPVMIVNEAAARLYFPNGKAVGHRGHPGGETGPWREVVGVVANVRHWGLDVEPRPEQYYCHLQNPTWMVHIAVRADGDPDRFAPEIRQSLRRLDARIPLARVQTMDAVVSHSIASERSILILLGVFATVALLLTATGIWGTMAYLLSQRRREIGIRLALGASESGLVRHAVGGAMRFVVVGVAAGAALSVAIVRLSAATLFGVSLVDPLTYASVAGVLVIVAWLANYYPARRITRSTPYSVLRQE